MSDNYYSNGQDIHFEMTTPEEERALFLKARRGCEKSREFLIHNHLLFAAMHAQAQVKGKLPKNEVISAANEAVMKAFNSFDPKRGFRFTTYLRPFIRGAVSALWRSKFSGGILDPSANVSVNDPTQTFAQSSRKGKLEDVGYVNPLLNIPDESPTAEEIDLTKFNRACLAAALTKLDKRDAELIRLRYVKGFTFTAIGKRRKVTREAVRARHVIIMKRLKRLLENKVEK